MKFCGLQSLNVKDKDLAVGELLLECRFVCLFLEYAEQTAVSSGDNVLAAVYQSVLGSVYTDNRRLLDDGVDIGKEYYAKSMAHPDALASAYATGYEPFVVDGVDSKYYYDDLLHVIGMRAGDYRTMHDYYASHGKREGALLTALELVKKSRRAGDEGRVKKSKYIMSALCAGIAF